MNRIQNMLPGWYRSSVALGMEETRPDAIRLEAQLKVGMYVVTFCIWTAPPDLGVSANRDKTAIVDDRKAFRIEGTPIDRGPKQHIPVTPVDRHGDAVPSSSPLLDGDFFVNGHLVVDPVERERGMADEGLIAVSSEPYSPPIDSLAVPQGYINGDNGYATCWLRHNLAVLLESQIQTYAVMPDWGATAKDLLRGLPDSD